MKVDVRSIAADESEFGVTIKTSRTKKSRARLNLFGMPNVALSRLPAANRSERSWRECASWSVPLDDEHYVSFNLTLIYLTGKKAHRFRQRRARTFARARISTAEMAARIVAGNATIDDFRAKAPNIIRLEDEVVLAAQGAIPDRKNETLGRSDMAWCFCGKYGCANWRRLLKAGRSRNGRAPPRCWRPPVFQSRSFSHWRGRCRKEALIEWTSRLDGVFGHFA